MSVLLSGWELREPETLLPVRPEDRRICRLKTNEVVICFMCLSSSSLLVAPPWGWGGDVPQGWKNLALCSMESSGGRAVHLQRRCCAVQRHAGMHLPGFAEEETRGGGGVGLLAWRDPLSAPWFLPSEGGITAAHTGNRIYVLSHPSDKCREKKPYTKLRDGWGRKSPLLTVE